MELVAVGVNRVGGCRGFRLRVAGGLLRPSVVERSTTKCMNEWGCQVAGF